ncbi:thioredoxin-like domain-containing protein [Micromonospora sp. CA-249363]|uniref:thioredoxin-like domain-containing protein n=1 Tax=Micromonospora sp. CA-249363 TaxID=3239963 RepID=UPI003D90C18B
MRKRIGRTAAAQPPRVAIVGALLAALLATTACTGTVPPDAAAAGTAPATTSSPTPSATPSADASSAPAAPVPDTLRFTGTILAGSAFDATRLAGRPVVLWFWAPWCATCASQAWTVAEIAPKYRDTVPIVGVAGLGEQRDMKNFVTEFDLGDMPQIDDRKGVLWKRFKVTEQSIFVIIDGNGKVVHQGFLDGESLTARVAALAGA